MLRSDASRYFSQEKWFRAFSTGEIAVRDVAYQLKVTDNKRQAIYENGIFCATTPYHYSEIEHKNKF